MQEGEEDQMGGIRWFAKGDVWEVGLYLLSIILRNVDPQLSRFLRDALPTLDCSKLANLRCMSVV